MQSGDETALAAHDTAATLDATLTAAVAIRAPGVLVRSHEATPRPEQRIELATKQTGEAFAAVKEE